MGRILTHLTDGLRGSTDILSRRLRILKIWLGIRIKKPPRLVRLVRLVDLYIRPPYDS
jgi:hypothetical protein